MQPLGHSTLTPQTDRQDGQTDRDSGPIVYDETFYKRRRKTAGPFIALRYFSQRLHRIFDSWRTTVWYRVPVHHDPVAYSALYSVYFVHQLIIERQQRIHNSWRNYMQLLQFYKISKFLKYSDVEH